MNETIEQILLGRRKKRTMVRVIFLIVGAFLLFRYVARPVKVYSEGMKPTISEGEYVLVSPLWTWVKGVDRNDIVGLKAAGDNYLHIGRITALPGESFEMRNSKPYINNRLFQTPVYRKGPLDILEDYEPIHLNSNEYLVMGDNKELSLIELHTEGSFGRVEKGRIVGKILLK